MSKKEEEPFNPFEEGMRENKPNLFALDKYKDKEPFDVIDGKTYYDMDMAWNKAKFGIVNWFTYHNLKVLVCCKVYGFEEHSKEPKIGEPYKSYQEGLERIKIKMDVMDRFVEQGAIEPGKRDEEKYGDAIEVAIPFLDKVGHYPREYLPDEVIELRTGIEDALGTDRWTVKEALFRELWMQKKLANSLEWVLAKQENEELP